MRTRLRKIARQLKAELEVYRCLARHPQTPRRSRWLLGAAIAYAVSPIDLIPDFIPLIGHLDDAVVVPLLVYLALRSVPQALVEECRRTVAHGQIPRLESGQGDLHNQ